MYNPVPAVVTFSTSPYFPNGQMSPSPTHHLDQGLQQQQKEGRPKQQLQHESITFGNSCPVVSVLQKDTSSDEEIVEEEINNIRYRDQGPPQPTRHEQGPPRHDQGPPRHDQGPPRHAVDRDQGLRQTQPPFSKETRNQPQSQMTAQNIPQQTMQHHNPTTMVQHHTPPQPTIVQQHNPPAMVQHHTPPTMVQHHTPPTTVPSMHQYPQGSPSQPLPYQTPPNHHQTPPAHSSSPPATKPTYTPQAPRTENAVKRAPPAQQQIYTPQPPRTENPVKRSQPESYTPQPPRSERIENAMKRVAQPLPESCTPQLPQPPKQENPIKRSPETKPPAPPAKPEPSPKPREPVAAPEPEEASGPKSWASLFSSNSAPGGPRDPSLLPVDKPTARIPPFSAQSSDVGGGIGEAGVTSGPTSQEKELGNFLRSYKLNHMAPSFLPRGLTNRSNWCFVNAILQSLQACPPFYNMLKALRLTPTGLRTSKNPLLQSSIPLLSLSASFPLLRL